MSHEQFDTPWKLDKALDRLLEKEFRHMTQFKNLIVDECEDANGQHTIRIADGSLNGDTERSCIATVYDTDYTNLFAAAPVMLAALKAARKFIGYRVQDCEVAEQLRAAITQAEGRG